MAKRSKQSFFKRQRELKRLERAAEKRRKREERRRKAAEGGDLEEGEKGPPIEEAEDYFAARGGSEADGLPAGEGDEDRGGT